jgi:hypothetical protein
VKTQTKSPKLKHSNQLRGWRESLLRICDTA